MDTFIEAIERFCKKAERFVNDRARVQKSRTVDKNTILLQTEDHMAFGFRNGGEIRTKVVQRKVWESFCARIPRWKKIRRAIFDIKNIIFITIFTLAVLLLIRYAGAWTISEKQLDVVFAGAFFLGTMAMLFSFPENQKKLMGAEHLLTEKLFRLRYERCESRKISTSEFPKTFDTLGMITQYYSINVFFWFVYCMLIFRPVGLWTTIFTFILADYILPCIACILDFAGGERLRTFMKIPILPQLAFVSRPDPEDIELAVATYNALYEQQEKEGIFDMETETQIKFDFD